MGPRLKPERGQFHLWLRHEMAPHRRGLFSGSAQRAVVLRDPYRTLVTANFRESIVNAGKTGKMDGLQSVGETSAKRRTPARGWA